MPGQAPPLEDERELLLAYIAQQRDGIRYAAYGLTDEQARMAPTASSLTIGGLVKHVADMERGWIDTALQRQKGGTFQEQMASYMENFQLGPDETLADALALLDDAARETEAAIRTVDLNQPMDRALGAAPPHRGDRPPRRPRRHRAGGDRRRHHVRA